jgi:rhodanese-related sulfurtransferase
VPVMRRAMMSGMSSDTESSDLQAIGGDELIRALRERRVTLVDVLSPESFARKHIPGAINLPVADLSSGATLLLPNLAAAIVVYCGGPT